MVEGVQQLPTPEQSVVGGAGEGGDSPAPASPSLAREALPANKSNALVTSVSETELSATEIPGYLPDRPYFTALLDIRGFLH